MQLVMLKKINNFLGRNYAGKKHRRIFLLPLKNISSMQTLKFLVNFNMIVKIIKKNKSAIAGASRAVYLVLALVRNYVSVRLLNQEGIFKWGEILSFVKKTGRFNIKMIPRVDQENGVVS